MKKALILIDIQNDYFSGGRFELNRTDAAAQNAQSALALFRKKGLPVFHVQHINQNPEPPFLSLIPKVSKSIPWYHPYLVKS